MDLIFRDKDTRSKTNAHCKKVRPCTIKGNYKKNCSCGITDCSQNVFKFHDYPIFILSLLNYYIANITIFVILNTFFIISSFRKYQAIQYFGEFSDYFTK